MRKKIIIILIVIFSCVYCRSNKDVSNLSNPVYKEKKFSLLEWKKYPNKRYKMIDDLLKNHKKELILKEKLDFFQSEEPYTMGYFIGKKGILRKCNMVLYINSVDKIELDCLNTRIE
jgi:hypothetical protein